jgi:DNA-binding response OmpR family regulator
MNRILILSADLHLLDRLAPAMRQAEFDVVCASDIAEGLKRLDETDINLVIIDEFLATDSWQLCQRIGQLFHTTIIFLGSRPSQEAWAGAEGTGFDLYLEKPISPHELSARAKALLRRKEPVRS